MNFRFLIASCALGFATASVFGQTRVTSTYRMATEALTGGGGRVASASYTMQTSVDGWAAPAVATAPSASLKTGFAGQLYEVSGLQLAASPSVVNEGGASLLSARAELDDASLLGLSNSNVVWRNYSSVLAGVTLGGLATAGNVYQTTAALVGGQYLDVSNVVSLTVLNVNPDDFGLFGGDGIPDHWQVDIFGENNPLGMAAADPDGDGQNNLLEYMAGVSPVDAASRFYFQLGLRQGHSQSLVFSPSLPGRRYTVLYCTHLGSSPFLPLTTLSQTNFGFTCIVTDNNAAEAAKFYRVDISLP